MLSKRSLVCILMAASFGAGCKPPPPTANSGTSTAEAPEGDSSAAGAILRGDQSSSAPSGSAAEDLSAAMPEFQLKADDFVQEVTTNPQTAVSQYDGKVVQVEGEVSSAGDDIVWISGFPFQFHRPNQKLWQKLTRRSQVTIKGRFGTRTESTGALTRELQNSVLVAHSPDARPAVTAEEFSAAARQDPAAFLQTYKSVEVLLTGEVAAYEVGPGQRDAIILKTSAPPRIVMQRVGFIKPREQDQALFAVGKNVVVTAQLHVFNDDLSSQIVVTFDNAGLAAEAAAR